ncbi:MAG: helix-turn-helix transcriptional regulator [Alphaproteobacteria bacterium]|nr:helix-turn-helix transcriptional regulator [Alphaproteobacteria bacterium]MDE2164679.1 helix-turn-helix transcriptional regulator [Alphaproteobacteria bacterium]
MDTSGAARSAATLDCFIGGRIRAYRTERSLTQTQLAAHLNITFQQVQKYEDGTNRVSAARLFEIARVLEIPLLAFYPEAAGALAASDRPAEPERLSAFAASAEGMRLCRAFLRLQDTRLRRKIIAFMEEVAEAEECIEPVG